MNRSPGRSLLIAALKLGILALVIWGGHRTIMQAIDDLRAGDWSVEQLQPAWLIVAALVYTVGMIPAGLFWHRVLAEMGQRSPLGRTLRAFLIGHVGKYVPGKAMVFVIRAGLIKGTQVRTGVAVAAIFYETLTTMAIGAAMAAIFLTMGYWEEHWEVAIVAAGLALALGFPTAPYLFNRLLAVLKKDELEERAGSAAKGKAVRAEVAPAARIHVAHLVPGWVGIAAGWVFFGLSLWAVIRGMGETKLGPLEGLPLYISAVALANVLGFVSLLPGGVGVREVVLLELLAPDFGAAVAGAAAIILRLVWLGAEVILATVLYFSGQRLVLRRRP